MICLIDAPVLGQEGFDAEALDSWLNQISGDDADLLYETESIDVLDAAYNPGAEITEGMILDAVSTKYNRFPRTMQALARVFARHSDDLEVLQPEMGKPRRAGGIATVTAQFPFSDGQRVSVVFHAPGDGRISGNDTLVAYRWLLNKRDITVAIAPEMTKGVMRDIPLQTVAKRVMRLVTQNSSKFQQQQQRVQKQRAAADEAEQLVEQLSSRLTQLDTEIEALQDDKEGRKTEVDQLELKLTRLKKLNAGLAKVAPVKAGSLEQTIRAQDMEVSARLEVVPISSLITSDMAEFDQRLQPRDRTRESSNQQIQEILRNFDPNQLLAAPTADTGAPIVSSDNFVESGNGRTMALRRVAEDQLLHRRYAKAVEDATGLRVRDGEVLIRRRTSDLNQEDRATFTVKANNLNIASMSATERGLADAALIDDGMLAGLKNADFTQLANGDFVRGFLGKLSANDRGAMVDEGEQLSQTGVQRMRNALLAAAYNNPGTMARITESTDDNVKSISGALVDAAPMIARLRRDVEAGRIKPEFDISGQIAEAAAKVSQARAAGTAISELLSQTDIFAEPDPITDELIKSFYNAALTRAVSRDKIADTLIRYADQARNETVEGNLFGDSITPDQILADLNGKRNASQNQSGLFDSANQFFLHPLHDGMRLTRERTEGGEFSPAVLWATMGMLDAGDGAAMMTELEEMAVLDAAYNAGNFEFDMFLVLDAVSSEYGARLPRSLKALQRAFNRQLPDDLKTQEEAIVGKPRRAGGFATVTAQFPFGDGQTVSIVFHVPGADGRVINGDELIAFRWLLNKRDITVAVAPEMARGVMRDIPLQTVARRVTQLLEKNSERFTARQTKAANESAALVVAETQVNGLTTKVETLTRTISDLKSSESLNTDIQSLSGNLEWLEHENEMLQKKIDKKRKAAEGEKKDAATPTGSASVSREVPNLPFSDADGGNLSVSVSRGQVEFKHSENTHMGQRPQGQWWWSLEEVINGKRVTGDDLVENLNTVLETKERLWVDIYNQELEKVLEAVTATGNADHGKLEGLIVDWLKKQGVSNPNATMVVEDMLPVLFWDIGKDSPGIINQLEEYFNGKEMNTRWAAMDARNGHAPGKSENDRLASALEAVKQEPEPETTPTESDLPETTYYIALDGENNAQGTYNDFQDRTTYVYKRVGSAKAKAGKVESGRVMAVTGRIDLSSLQSHHEDKHQTLADVAERLAKGESDVRIKGTGRIFKYDGHPFSGQFVDSSTKAEPAGGLKLKGLAKTWHELSQGMDTGAVKPERAIELSQKFNADREKLERKALPRVSADNLRQMLNNVPEFASGVRRSDIKIHLIDEYIKELAAKIEALGEKADQVLSDPDYVPEITKENTVSGLSLNHAPWAQKLADQIKAEAMTGESAALIYSDPKYAVLRYKGVNYAMKYPESVKAAEQREDLFQPDKSGSYSGGDRKPEVLKPMFVLEAGEQYPKAALMRMRKAAKQADNMLQRAENGEKEIELEGGYTAINSSDNKHLQSWQLRTPDGEEVPPFKTTDGKIGGIYDTLPDAVAAIQGGSYKPTAADLEYAEKEREKERAVHQKQSLPERITEEVAGMNLKGLAKTWYENTRRLRALTVSPQEQYNLAKAFWADRESIESALGRLSVGKLSDFMYGFSNRAADPTDKISNVNYLINDYIPMCLCIGLPEDSGVKLRKAYRSRDYMLEVLAEHAGIEPERQEFNPETFLKIVADTPDDLRAIDIDRLIVEADGNARAMADYVVEHRPDLLSQVASVLRFVER